MYLVVSAAEIGELILKTSLYKKKIRYTFYDAQKKRLVGDHWVPRNSDKSQKFSNVHINTPTNCQKSHVLRSSRLHLVGDH